MSTLSERINDRQMRSAMLYGELTGLVRKVVNILPEKEHDRAIELLRAQSDIDAEAMSDRIEYDVHS